MGNVPRSPLDIFESSSPKGTTAQTNQTTLFATSWVSPRQLDNYS